MKTRNRFILLICVLIATMAFAGVATAKATITEFTGTEVQIGGADPVKYWEAGRTVHIRDMTSIYLETSTDPRTSGTNTVIGSINIHPAPGGARGQVWGTFTLENDNGYWVGAYSGSFSPDGTLSYTARGKGYGDYAGLLMTIIAQHALGDVETTYSGYILDPGH